MKEALSKWSGFSVGFTIHHQKELDMRDQILA